MLYIPACSSDVWKIADLLRKNLTWQRLVKRYNCFTTLNVLDISHRSFYQRFPDNILRMTLQSRTSIFDWNLQADLIKIINDQAWLTCCWLTLRCMKCFISIRGSTRHLDLRLSKLHTKYKLRCRDGTDTSALWSCYIQS